MKKKVLPVAANFSLNKKQRIRKEVPFSGGTSFLRENMVNISLEQCFLKHLYKPHKTIYNAVKTKKNNI